MPAKKPAKTPPPAAADNEPLYPAIEGFIERATAEEIAELFSPLKEGLSALKGPRADQAKKVGKAIAKTEELLSHLLQVREKLEAERKDKPAARR
ncbi:MAG: hypothetical protein H6Q89_4103 [Myxococcaceae bacterium]|nr:hypothetical protein [Myxococcaceae bacterium]